MKPDVPDHEFLRDLRRSIPGFLTLVALVVGVLLAWLILLAALVTLFDAL